MFWVLYVVFCAGHRNAVPCLETTRWDRERLDGNSPAGGGQACCRRNFLDISWERDAQLEPSLIAAEANIRSPARGRKSWDMIRMVDAREITLLRRWQLEIGRSQFGSKHGVGIVLGKNNSGRETGLP